MRRFAVPALVALCAASSSALAAPVTAQKADRFVDSIGVNTHFDTYNVSLVQSRLQELGVRHVRDNANSQGIAAAQTLGSLGIKTTFICGRKYPSGKLNVSEVGDELTALKPVASAIAALEGPNEYDLQHGDLDVTTWPTTLVNYQKALFSQANASSTFSSKPMIGPSLTSDTAADAVRSANGGSSLSSSMDYSCLHLYQSWRWPGNPGYGGSYGSIDWSIANIATVVGGSKPIQSTEGGYNTGRTADNRYVSEDVEAKYLPRMFAEFFRRGFYRSFKYELRDTGSGGEQGFGIVRSDATPKPAFNSLKNLIGALGDPDASANFTPGSLDYSLTGADSNTRQLLFQKSDGTFYLLLWREVQSWTGDATNAPVTVTPDPLTLSFGAGVTGVATNLPKNNATFSAQTVSNNAVNLSVPDQIMIVRVTMGTSNTLGTFHLQNAWSSQYLRENTSGSLSTLDFDASDAPQEWAVTDAGGGYSRIKNLSTGEYLRNHSDNTVSTIALVSSDTRQQWKFEDAGGGYKWIRNRSTGRYLRENVDTLAIVTEPLDSTRTSFKWMLRAGSSANSSAALSAPSQVEAAAPSGSSS